MTDAPAFQLTSTDVQPNSTIANEHVFNGFGCSGANISPALSWSGAPEGTRSFAITVYDPDAPTGGGWWHWMVYDIPASVTHLPSGAGNSGSKTLPQGAKMGMTDYGVRLWGGPCPPAGDKPHGYVFTVLALGVERVDVPENATSGMLGFNLHGNALATASFVCFYGR